MSDEKLIFIPLLSRKDRPEEPRLFVHTCKFYELELIVEADCSLAMVVCSCI